MKTFTIKDFNTKYPNDDACLKSILEARYGKICPYCTRLVKFYKLNGRKCYLCNNCKEHIYPLADTIFHKSETPLKNWFYAIYLFSTSKNGVSSMELQRQIGCTYKTAWRMAKQIRTLMAQSKNQKTNGTFEADETFYGGKSNKKGRGDKTPIFGLIRRKGKSNQSKIVSKVVKNTSSSTLLPIIRSNVDIGSDLMTDEYPVYNKTSKLGYYHGFVKHKERQYAKGFTHTNTIEGFWSQLKRSIDGTYHAVSRKYLQTYLDEFVYRYNHRGASTFVFDLLLGRVVQTIG